jgi:hypothetical protein
VGNDPEEDDSYTENHPFLNLALERSVTRVICLDARVENFDAFPHQLHTHQLHTAFISRSYADVISALGILVICGFGNR